MPSLISAALTKDQVWDRSKTVTRRLGWWRLTEGTPLTVCEKVQGRRKPDGTVDPLVRIAEVIVVSARPEPLSAITPQDVIAEGFPEWTPADFIDFYCASMKCQPDTVVNRIEWRYLPEATDG